MAGVRMIAAVLLVVMATGSAAQTPRDRKMIAHAKAIPVSQLDAKLPSVPLEQWLEKQAGEGARITWEVNDCGEQGGSPQEGERDFPVCVEADAHLGDKREIVVSIAVGTYKAGISGKPAVWWITVGRDPNRDEPLESLSEVPEELRETRDVPPVREAPPKKPDGK
jgi:hypothetical protein